MKAFGEAVAHGAVTIINAIATGRGAALGIDLWTKARVKLTDEPRVVRGRILSEPEENTQLIEAAVGSVLRHYGAYKRHGAWVETDSNIPIAKGLKSSSAASNALVLAAAAALGQKIDKLTAVKLGVKAALKAKTTITGAFDDACASFLGNIVITDNLKCKLLKRTVLKKEYRVLIHIPPGKYYTALSDVDGMRLIAPQVEVALQEAMKGNYWTALTLNGFLYASILRCDQKPALEALRAGATAAGLSGKGPATVAVVTPDKVEAIADVWKSYKGTIINAGVNREKAHIVGSIGCST